MLATCSRVGELESIKPFDNIVHFLFKRTGQDIQGIFRWLQKAQDQLSYVPVSPDFLLVIQLVII